jgi:Sel1 repeat
MALREFLSSMFALLACCAMPLASQRVNAGSTDAIFIAPSVGTKESAPYDSEYAAAAKEMGSVNTPEADARPGEYYFMVAVHAFRKNDFAFAIQMYEVAASWAFKPAEYNLGVMYSRGQGVPVDMARGMAWMALAAERNEKRYVDAREVIYAELTKEQFEQANGIWRELKKTYGDEVALRRAKARWAQVKSSMTGSRVGSVGNLTVGMPNANMGDPSNQKNQKTGANVHTSVGTAAEITGGNGVDGSIAYGQLRESDNPYDPKFKQAIGTATVGEPSAVKAKTPDETAPEPDPIKHD